MAAVATFELLEFPTEAPVTSCEASAIDDGNGVLSVAAGKNVYFFDGVNTGRLTKKVKLPYTVASVAYHSEARKFVTGSNDDTWVRVYDYDEDTELGKCFPNSTLSILVNEHRRP